MRSFRPSVHLEKDEEAEQLKDALNERFSVQDGFKMRGRIACWFRPGFDDNVVHAHWLTALHSIPTVHRMPAIQKSALPSSCLKPCLNVNSLR